MHRYETGAPLLRDIEMYTTMIQAYIRPYQERINNGKKSFKNQTGNDFDKTDIAHCCILALII